MEIDKVPEFVREISSFEVCSCVCQQKNRFFQYQVLRLFLLCSEREC